MIETKYRNCHPDRRRGTGTDFEDGEPGNPNREHDLEVDRVAATHLDLPIDVLEKVHDHPRGMGMFGKEFSFLLDLVGERVDFV